MTFQFSACLKAKDDWTEESDKDTNERQGELEYESSAKLSRWSDLDAFDALALRLRGHWQEFGRRQDLDFGFEVGELLEVLKEENSFFITSDGNQLLLVDLLSDADGVQHDAQGSARVDLECKGFCHAWWLFARLHCGATLPDYDYQSRD